MYEVIKQLLKNIIWKLIDDFSINCPNNQLWLMKYNNYDKIIYGSYGTRATVEF